MVERFVDGYKKNKMLCFMVFDQENNFIGRSGFIYADELNIVEMGYVLDHKSWGKGYATEIANALLEWARDAFEYKEIFAIARIDHLASISIMKKVGMEYVDNRTLEGMLVFCIR